MIVVPSAAYPAPYPGVADMSLGYGAGGGFAPPLLPHHYPPAQLPARQVTVAHSLVYTG